MLRYRIMRKATIQLEKVRDERHANYRTNQLNKNKHANASLKGDKQPS